MGKEVSRKEAAVCEADQYSPQGESGQGWLLEEAVLGTCLLLGEGSQ